VINVDLRMEKSMEPTYGYLRHKLLKKAYGGEIVDTGHWQGLRDVPHTRTVELQNVTMEMGITESPLAWAAFTKPNLPWAEDHFHERVAGEPLNPGEQYKNWPWYRGGVESHKKTCCENPRPGPLVKERCLGCGQLLKATGQFSHTYMERFWPKEVGDYQFNGGNFGIRYELGDLNDVVSILERDPGTRQAYLPIWFPEDATASLQDQRVPCSLGYHFMLRQGQLHCMYTMRSVDFVRYLADDLYMAGRLVQWIIKELVDREFATHEEKMTHEYLWDGVTPGKLLFTAASLHAFEGDIPKLRRESTHAAV